MIGLTLEGGGAKGAYQIGAWRAFNELGLDFQGISGTSVGALNGALMIQGDYDTAHEIWHNVSPTKIMNIDDRIYEMIAEHHLTSDNLQLFFEEARRTIKGFGIDNKPLQDLITNTLREDVIRNSSKDFGFVTVCLTDRKPLEIYKEQIPIGKMADYLMASAYLPVFKSKKLDGKLFIDGGIYDNLPFEMLYKKGYRKIIAVRLFGSGRIRKIKHKDLEVIYISPQKSLGNILDFSTDRARQNIMLGYLDTLKVFRRLKGKTFYIEGVINEKDALAFFMNLDSNAVKKLGQLFKLPHNIPLNRLILEEIIPRFIKLMELGNEATYSDVYFGVIEAIASLKKLEAHKIYTLEEIIDTINSIPFIPIKNKKDFLINTDIIDDIILKFDRQKLLMEALNIIMQFEKNLLKPL
ncbi:patatin-like phospholipase family protein [Alkaliphilus peptidifermentans]|uniref:NTE family protein n=1 Tax=Alkaliphilus peptidifermentans DSM 18978 TaxID=1120976 RepID=A0A1G5FIQ8_9FIRM|nr:patatin-like phospholipase family protein [Alkaliphilus peptidifermentans]SCY39175.1 NTE family protein [Alkaliphilus peptidifermentans DSM 18978]